MLKYYGVTPFPPSKNATGNSVKTVLDSLLNAFEEKPVPPHTLVILLDDNNFWCDDLLLTQDKNKPMTRIVNTMLIEIRKILEKRIRQLPIKCIPEYTTRIFVGKLTYRPDDAHGIPENFKSKRREFNRLLETLATDKGHQTISLDEITPKVDGAFFLTHGTLSNKGYNQIWLSLSNAIEDYDLHGNQKIKTFKNSEQNRDTIDKYYTTEGVHRLHDQDESSDEDRTLSGPKSVVFPVHHRHEDNRFNKKARRFSNQTRNWNRNRRTRPQSNWKNDYY